MALDVSRALREPGEMIPFEATADIELERDDFIENGPATMRGQMTAIGESIAVMGKITLPGKARCARCLEEFPTEIFARLEETFVRKGNLQEQSEDDEGDEAMLYEGEAIELDRAAEAALYLNMPMRFLCKTSCKGLCPICGKDRNQSPCTCPNNDDDNPFSALRSLLTDE